MGHTRVVNAIAVLPDYKIASGSWDKTIRVWDAASGQCLFTLVGHTDAVVTLAALPDGKLASGSYDRTVRVWKDDACLFTLEGHTSPVFALAVLHDDKLASSSLNVIQIWDTVSGENLLTLTHKSRSYVVALAGLPDGKLISGSDVATVWDVCSGECLRTLPSPAAIYALLALSNGNCLVGYRDDSMRLWNPTNGECLFARQASFPIFFLVHVSDGEIASGSQYNVSLWDVESMTLGQDASKHEWWPCIVCLLKENETLFLNIQKNSKDYIFFCMTKKITTIYD
jgi:WD40 repeat protein